MRKIVITEEELYSIIENVITELNKDINEPLWNVYRIPSKIGANGYSISSSLNENNLLNQLYQLTMRTVLVICLNILLL